MSGWNKLHDGFWADGQQSARNGMAISEAVDPARHSVARILPPRRQGERADLPRRNWTGGPDAPDHAARHDNRRGTQGELPPVARRLPALRRAELPRGCSWGSLSFSRAHCPCMKGE